MQTKLSDSFERTLKLINPLSTEILCSHVGVDLDDIAKSMMGNLNAEISDVYLHYELTEENEFREDAEMKEEKRDTLR